MMVDANVVRKLVAALCSMNHGIVMLSFDPHCQKQLFLCLHGHVQSGKTKGMTLLLLILYVKYNLGCIALILNTASIS